MIKVSTADVDIEGFNDKYSKKYNKIAKYTFMDYNSRWSFIITADYFSAIARARNDFRNTRRTNFGCIHLIGITQERSQ